MRKGSLESARDPDGGVPSPTGLPDQRSSITPKSPNSLGFNLAHRRFERRTSPGPHLIEEYAWLFGKPHRAPVRPVWPPMAIWETPPCPGPPGLATEEPRSDGPGSLQPGAGRPPQMNACKIVRRDAGPSGRGGQ